MGILRWSLILGHYSTSSFCHFYKPWATFQTNSALTLLDEPHLWYGAHCMQLSPATHTYVQNVRSALLHWARVVIQYLTSQTLPGHLCLVFSKHWNSFSVMRDTQSNLWFTKFNAKHNRSISIELREASANMLSQSLELLTVKSPPVLLQFDVSLIQLRQ